MSRALLIVVVVLVLSGCPLRSTVVQPLPPPPSVCPYDLVGPC